jgi:hypothetical protein
MSKLFELLKAFFDEAGWSYTPEPHAPSLMVAFHTPQGERYLFAQVEGEDLCLLTSIIPLEVPEERRFELLSFLNELNGRTALGSFYLDEEGGSVQFTTGVDARDEQGKLFSKEVLFAFLERSLMYNLNLHDLLYPHIRAVSEGLDLESALAGALEDLAE